MSMFVLRCHEISPRRLCSSLCLTTLQRRAQSCGDAASQVIHEIPPPFELEDARLEVGSAVDDAGGHAHGVAVGGYATLDQLRGVQQLCDLAQRLAPVAKLKRARARNDAGRVDSSQFRG